MLRRLGVIALAVLTALGVLTAPAWAAPAPAHYTGGAKCNRLMESV